MWTLSPGRGHFVRAGDVVARPPAGTLYATEPNKNDPANNRPYRPYRRPPFATLACSEIWERVFKMAVALGKRIQPQLATATAHCLGFEHPALSKAEASTP